MTMTYSVIGRGTKAHLSARHSLELLRARHRLLGVSLSLLPADSDDVVPHHFAYELDHLTTLLDNIVYLVPEIGPVYLCGYSWGHHGDAFTTWSGHPSRVIAERWLSAWREWSTKDTWEIREGTCDLGKFMPKGTRIAPVMKRLRRSA